MKYVICFLGWFNSLCKLVGYVIVLSLLVSILYYLLWNPLRGALPGSPFEIMCDSEADGARVFVDGVFDGVLRRTGGGKNASQGPTTASSLEWCRGESTRTIKGQTWNDVIRAEEGRRAISVICPDGRRLDRNITVAAENYVDIECKKGEISGRP